MYCIQYALMDYRTVQLSIFGDHFMTVQFRTSLKEITTQVAFKVGRSEMGSNFAE